MKNMWNTCIEFVQKYWRYFLAVLVFIAIILMTIFVISKKSTLDQNQSGVYEEFEVNAHPELNSLIENYYSNYAAGNVDVLTTYATPISDSEKSYIKMLSQYIEAFNVVDVYSKKGLEKDSYLVSVYVKEKFVGVNTAAPGLDFFYVRTNENGILYIDNVYSNFNQQEQENAMDADVAEVIDIYRQRDDTMTLKSKVSAELDSAFAADANLEKLVKETLPTKIGEWKAQNQAQKAQQQAIAQAKQKEAEDAAIKAQQDAAAAAAKAQQDAAEEANKTVVTIKEKVNVRASASENGDKLGTIEGGTQVTKYGEENGFTKIDYNGTKAYVKSEYVEAAAPAAPEAPAAQPAAATPVNKVIELTQSVNVRSGMSETASRIAGAIPGNKVTVIEEYPEGWSKVSFNGQEGYIKTEFLR